MAAVSFNADTRKKKNGKTKQKTKITIFIIEMLIIVAMLIVVWKVFQTTEDTEGPHKVTIDENEIVFNELHPSKILSSKLYTPRGIERSEEHTSELQSR